MAERALPVTVVDYGLGNLYSVTRALAAVGGDPKLTSDPVDVARAERLVLPGVGAFADGMAGLRERGLVDALKAFAATGRPFLGICLGMQLLMREGTEFGRHEGLGLVEGSVTLLTPEAAGGRPPKLPHIGWNALGGEPARWKDSALGALAPGAQVYFVHSYAPAPSDPADVLATCEYGGRPFCAALKRGNLTGCQFHPEKSGPVGLAILERFLHG